MNTNTTLNRGAADMPEALHRSTAADGKTELFNLPGYPLMVRAVDFNRIHAESEMRRAALLDEMQKAALAAGQATAAQAVVPAEWPTNEMIDAGRKAAASQGRLLGSGQSLWHVFRAMLAAAPAQPAAQQAGEPDGTVGYTVHGTQYVNWRTKPPAHGTPLYTTPQPTRPDPAYSEACNLATALFKKYFAHLPDFASGQAVWGLCGSTAGVISQIDNMVSGLLQPPTTAFSEDEL